MQSGRSFQWPGGAPPLDIPKCGFKNDSPSCVARKRHMLTTMLVYVHISILAYLLFLLLGTVSVHQMVAIVTSFLFVIVVTVTVFIYR